MKIKVIISVCVLLVFGVVTGCQYTLPAKLRVDSVTFIDKKALLERVVGEDISIPLLSEWSVDNFFVVRLSSDLDVIDFMRSKNCSVGASGFFCHRPSELAMLVVPSLYSDGKNVSYILLEEEPEVRRNESCYFYYDLILLGSWQKKRQLPSAFRKNKSQEYYAMYSLCKMPEDICLEIFGGNMINSYKSQVITISTKLISEAMNK